MNQSRMHACVRESRAKRGSVARLLAMNVCRQTSDEQSGSAVERRDSCRVSESGIGVMHRMLDRGRGRAGA